MPIWRLPPPPQQPRPHVLITEGASLTLILADAVAITDVITKGVAAYRSEAIGIGDLFSRVSAFIREQADSVAIADANAKKSSLIGQDALTISDLRVSGFAPSRIETVGISDLFSKVSDFILTQSDTLTITDAAARAAGLSLADTIVLTDSLGKIIGSGIVSVENRLPVDTFYLSKFTAEFTGTVRQVRINSNYTHNVKVAIYADSVGEPGALLNAISVSQPVVPGWNKIVFPATAVVLGTDYWLGFNSG